MEPTAYRYFNGARHLRRRHDVPAEFLRTRQQVGAALSGFVQGALQSQEIHVLDKARFNDGHGFFIFENRERGRSARAFRKATNAPPAITNMGLSTAPSSSSIRTCARSWVLGD